LHAFLGAFERDLVGDQRSHGDGARGREANRFLPTGTRVEPAAVHGQLAGEHRVEVTAIGSAWMATTLIVPQTRTASVMSLTAAALPVTSKATSTPSPSVQSLANLITSTPAPTTSSPRPLRRSTRKGLTSETMTRAPRWRKTRAIS